MRNLLRIQGIWLPSPGNAPLKFDSMDSARHHMLIAVARRARIGKSSGKIVLMDALERLHALCGVAGLDSDQRVGFREPDFTTAVFQKREDPYKCDRFRSKQDGSNVWIFHGTTVPAFVKPKLGHPQGLFQSLFTTGGDVTEESIQRPQASPVSSTTPNFSRSFQQ